MFSDVSLILMAAIVRARDELVRVATVRVATVRVTRPEGLDDLDE